MNYQIWLILGLALCVLEMFTMTFVLVWFGVSAMMVGILIWAGVLSASSVGGQALNFALLSIVMTGVWLSIQKKWKMRSQAGQSKDSVVGIEGIVKEARVNPEGTSGTVRFILPVLGNDEWEFTLEQNSEGNGEQLIHGDRVAIVDVVGQKLVVKKTY